MSTIASVHTDKAPAAVGPYSQAIDTGALVFVSGQIPLVPGTKDLAPGGIEGQAEQSLRNLTSVLLAAGLGLERVVKTTIFLTDMKNFPTVNEIYARHFGEHKPARSTIQVAGLPLGADIEIECIAAR